MPHTPNRRLGYFVDTQVQGTLLREAAGIWLCSAGVFAIIILVCRVFSSPAPGQDFQSAWYHLSPLLFTSVIVFPAIIYRATRLSHRIVAPMIQIRTALRKIAVGQQPRTLVFRENDFWHDIAEDINQIAIQRAASDTVGDDLNSRKDDERCRAPAETV